MEDERVHLRVDIIECEGRTNSAFETEFSGFVIDEG
jgi:hypothetical protein